MGKIVIVPAWEKKTPEINEIVFLEKEGSLESVRVPNHKKSTPPQEIFHEGEPKTREFKRLRVVKVDKEAEVCYCTAHKLVPHPKKPGCKKCNKNNYIIKLYLPASLVASAT
jgi:hypothetical protein